jgi:hypothetical protein
MGILNFDDPQQAGMMGLAQGLLASSGPSRMPVSLGQGLAQGMGQAQANYQAAQQSRNSNLEYQMHMMQLQQAVRDREITEPLARMAAAKIMARFGVSPSTTASASPSPTITPAAPILGQSAAGMPSAVPLIGQSAVSPPVIPQTSPSAQPVSAPAGGSDLFGLNDNQLLGTFLPGALGKAIVDANKPSEWESELKTLPPEMRQAAIQHKFTPPTSGRAGAPMWVTGPDGKLSVGGFAPKLDEGMVLQSDGSVGLVPGYAAAKEAIGSIPNPSAPMTDIHTSSDAILSLTQPEKLQFQKTGALPARYGNQSGSSMPAPMRNNNPGALMPGGKMAQYPTPEAGIAALDANLANYGKKGINTLEGVISRWAPPSENDTGAYISDAAKRLGIDPKQKIDLGNPLVRQAIGTAIMLHENGPSAVFSPQGSPSQYGTVGATQTQDQKVQQTRQIAAGKAVDESFGKDYVLFKTGGAQDALKQISQLQDVTQSLSKNSGLTGPMVGMIPNAIRNITNPEAIAMKERVEEVVQRSLRSILGAQFTENEGTRLIARAYNPSQPESENLIRVNRLLEQLKQGYQSKVDASNYFEKNGTLDGWSGKLPSIGDFDFSAGRMSSGTITGNASKSGAISAPAARLKPGQTIDFSQLPKN